MTDRVWRVRKHHTWMIEEGDDPVGLVGPAGVELRCYYDGQPIYTRRWPTRALALTDADARLKDLLRAGWTTHW